MVKSYNDPVKQKAREKLRDYIAAHILRTKSPRNVRVVCFPGAEIEGEEGLEVLQVYDPLGIPRENIVGLERDARNAARLRKAMPDLDVQEIDAYDFFRSERGKFDVVSLDYTGQRTWRESDITKYIAGKGILTSPGVFCTNHLVKREGMKMQEALLYGTIFSSGTSEVFGRLEMGLTMEEVGSRVTDGRDQNMNLYQEGKERLKRREINLDQIRHFITGGNLSILGGGITEINPQQNMFQRNQSLRDTIQSSIELNRGKPRKSKGIMGREGYWEHKTIFEEAFLAGQYALWNKFGLEKSLARRIVQVLALDAHNAYFPEDLQRFTYTSNKNGDMLFDIVCMRTIPRKVVNLVKQIVNLDSRGYFVLNPQKLKERKLLAAVEQLDEIYPEEKQIRLQQPVYLGSSYQPPRRKERISKDDAIELLRGGFSPVEIAECYRGFSPGQLRAFKAHLTMGTYPRK